LLIALIRVFWYVAPTPLGPELALLTESDGLATEEDFPMAFCSTCGAQIADGTTTCAACAGRAAAAPAPPPAAAAGGMADNVAGMLAYITIIPAIIFLVMEPYNKNRFIRFHAWQNIFFHGAWIVLWIGLMIVSAVLAFIPILGHLVAFLLWMALALGGLIIWIILLMKANGGQMYKLPFIGDLAEKQANAM
jgi:uncharacterized membrane protein